MATRDIRTDGLVLGGTVIPLSGSAGGERARLVFAESAVRVDAITKSIYGTTVNQRATLTIAAYPEEEASTILWGLWRAQRASLGVLNDALSGSLNRGPDIVARWARGCITVAPPIVSEESSTVQTWTIEVDGVS
jgi:hypothetical protein